MKLTQNRESKQQQLQTKKNLTTLYNRILLCLIITKTQKKILGTTCCEAGGNQCGQRQEDCGRVRTQDHLRQRPGRCRQKSRQHAQLRAHQGGKGHWTINYTGSQCYIAILSYIFA